MICAILKQFIRLLETSSCIPFVKWWASLCIFVLDPLLPPPLTELVFSSQPVCFTLLEVCEYLSLVVLTHIWNDSLILYTGGIKTRITNKSWFWNEVCKFPVNCITLLIPKGGLLYCVVYLCVPQRHTVILLLCFLFYFIFVLACLEEMTCYCYHTTQCVEY
jgi:hypothetical protein